MNFEDVLVDSSRTIADMVVQAIKEHPESLSELLDLALKDKGVVSSRAGRALAIYLESDTSPIKPFVSDIILRIPDIKSEGLKKNFLKFLTVYPFHGNEENLGFLLDYCMEWIISNEEAPATIIYSMYIAYRISNLEPDIKSELAGAIEAAIPPGSNGVKHVGKNFLKKLYSEMA